MQGFEELVDYVDLGADDVARLQVLEPILEPHFTEVIDAFYTAVETHVQARALFEGEEQLKHLRGELLTWLSSIFDGPFDASYAEKRRHIGRTHVSVGMPPHLLFGAMNIVRAGLVRAIFAHGSLDDPLPYAETINKVLDVELSIMVQTYWDDVMETKLQLPAALAAGVAHEIRNPLNAIGLQLTLLERKLRDIDGVGQSISDVIETVRRELRRLGGLTNEIIDFSKPIDLRRAWVEPAEIISKIEQIHGPSLAMMDVKLMTSIAGKGPAFCDAGRIHQVLVNLLTNGIDALDGRDDGTIELAIENRPRSTTIHLKDNGQGMTSTSRVFDLFYTTKASGTGMGLPVVRKIVEAHGGSVRVKSKHGEGTTFTLYLPRPAAEKSA